MIQLPNDESQFDPNALVSEAPGLVELPYLPDLPPNNTKVA